MKGVGTNQIAKFFSVQSNKSNDFSMDKTSKLIFLNGGKMLRYCMHSNIAFQFSVEIFYVESDCIFLNSKTL